MSYNTNNTNFTPPRPHSTKPDGSRNQRQRNRLGSDLSTQYEDPTRSPRDDMSAQYGEDPRVPSSSMGGRSQYSQYPQYRSSQTPQPTLGAGIREFGARRNIPEDADDYQIIQLFEQLCTAIRIWCRPYSRPPPSREPPLGSLQESEGFDELDQQKSRDVDIQELLKMPGLGQTIASAYIMHKLYESVFKTLDEVQSALEVIEKKMYTEGIPQYDIGKWRSVTYRAIAPVSEGEPSIDTRTDQIADEILEWIYENFRYSDTPEGKVRRDKLKETVITVASNLLVEMRKKSSKIDIKLYFKQKRGIITFDPESMQDVKDMTEVPLGRRLKVNLVVMPALLRLATAYGDDLPQPRVLRKAKVIWEEIGGIAEPYYIESQYVGAQPQRYASEDYGDRQPRYQSYPNYMEDPRAGSRLEYQDPRAYR